MSRDGFLDGSWEQVSFTKAGLVTVFQRLMRSQPWNIFNGTWDIACQILLRLKTTQCLVKGIIERKVGRKTKTCLPCSWSHVASSKPRAEMWFLAWRCAAGLGKVQGLNNRTTSCASVREEES